MTDNARMVDLPTGLGAIVSPSPFANNLGYILCQEGWRGLFTGRTYTSHEIANEIHLGGRVLYEGEDTP